MSATTAESRRTDLRPRQVLCPTEHLHRDVALADAARAGRWTNVGLTLELGPEPDWLDPRLPQDKEWRIAWWKHYVGLDLAHAFRVSGDVGYLEAWERVVASFARQVDVGADTTDVAARRVQNWVYAWDAFARAPRFPGIDAAVAQLALERLAADLAHVRAHLTEERNHRTLELYALFVVPLALPVLDPDGELLAFATEELGRNLATDFRPDGVHIEASTHYHLIALRSFVAARANARRYGLAFPGGFEERLHRACDFALHLHRPDGTIPAISDSDGGRYGELLALAADELGRDDLRWAATAGRDGAPPTVRAASFPDGGYHVQRSDWGEDGDPADARWLLLDCGPLGAGGHGHYDLLSVEVAAYGRPLLVDPGRFTYAEGEPNMRRWFKGTAAHNTVVVDGLDQTPYRRGAPRGEVAEGRLLGRAATGDLDVLVAEARSPAYDAVHVRRVVFVAGEYWLIEDVLDAPTEHTYAARFHLAPDAEGELRLREGAAVAPGLALAVHGAAALDVEPGWVAPEYGVKLPAPVVVATAGPARRARIVTLVAPLRDGEQPPRITVSERAGRVEAVVLGRAARDVVSWRPEDAEGARLEREAA